MKKIFLLSILLFQLTFVFGQNTQWSNWTSMSCYQGFKTSANNLGFVKSINEYSWKMKIKNNYNRRVHFNMSWIVGNEKQSIGRFSLNPGEETNHVSYYFKSNSTSWQVEVTEVCFGENWMSCTNGCYAECDNGSPKQPNCDKNTGSTNSTNQTNTSNQQNDPTFDRNNASFQDYYKRATAAGQAGNYDDAISLWNSAIAVAVNDDQRNNARAWLAEVEKAKANTINQAKNAEIQKENARRAEEERQKKIHQQQQYNNSLNQAQENINNKDYNGAIQSYGEAGKNASTKGEKNLAVAGIATSGALGILDGIQEQKEWSAEQKRLKAERLKQAEEYMRNLEQKFIDEINLADNGDIDKQNWVAYQFYDKQKYESAEEYYKMVMSNKDDSKISQRESSSNNLASCYAINGKFLEQWNELNKKNKYGDLIYYNKFQRAMLILFSKDYEINSIVSDEMKKLAIQDLKNEKPDYNSKVVLAYFQVTGEYESLGITKNEKEGLEILTKSTYSELASFFIGDLYLKGIGFKKDDKKAFDNFFNVVKLNKNQKIIKKFNVNSKSDLDFYKPIPNGLHNIYQLTPLIMAYSKIAIILEKSSKDSDRNLLKYKSEFLEWYGNLLNIEDRTFWKIKINQNPFLQTEKK